MDNAVKTNHIGNFIQKLGPLLGLIVLMATVSIINPSF